MRTYLLVCLALTFVFTCSSIAADKIVIVGSSIPFGEADGALKTHMLSLGFEVEDHAQTEAQPVDISGADGVLICESISSGNIADAYKDAPITPQTDAPAQDCFTIRRAHADSSDGSRAMRLFNTDSFLNSQQIQRV